jgi:hypothetical protein
LISDIYCVARTTAHASIRPAGYPYFDYAAAIDLIEHYYEDGDILSMRGAYFTEMSF